MLLGVGESGTAEKTQKKILKKSLHVPFVPIGYKGERVGTVKSGAQSSLRPCLYDRRGGVVPEAI